MTRKYYIPQGDQERKDAPIYRGVFGYFPAAIFEVARHSLESDRKHNPNNPAGPNWARGKSADHADCIARHLIDSGVGSKDAPPDQLYHLRALAWRALALLQEACEATGAADGVSCVRPADPPVPRVVEHLAQTMARDAALAEEVRNELELYGFLGERARVMAIKLARVRLGVGLDDARDWVDQHVPETKVKKS